MAQEPQPALGRRESRAGGVDAAAAAMLRATLGADAGPPLSRDLAHGEALPPLWHWAGFPETAPLEALGPDGHRKRGGFLPEIPQSSEDAPFRRMWAGGALRFHRPLHVGEPLSRVSTIAAVTPKTGAAGEMLLVTVAHEISGAHGLAVSERHDIIYLPAPERYAPPKAIPAPTDAAVQRRVAIDSVRLFRFSAALFNSHRIHYDLDYTREVEGYPGLLTHGPLQAMALAALATEHRGRPPSAFRYRARRPMFHFHDLRLLAVEPEEHGAPFRLYTAHPEEGHVGMSAEAEWR